MTTSGQTIIEMNRDSFIAAALRKIGAVALGQTPDTEEITNGAEALNNLVAQFQTLGMPLWARKELTIPLVIDQGSYIIGVGQAINSPFPLKVIQVWSVDSVGGSRQELTPNAIDNYNRLPTNLNAGGTPSQYTYQPFINFGVLKLWPVPDTSTVTNRILTISYMAPFEGFVDASNTPYFPREWNNAIIYGLADLLASEYGVPTQDRATFRKEAEMHKDIALDFGLENASLTFQPSADWTSRGF